MMTLGEACAFLPDAQLIGPADLPFERIHTDTRSLRPGDLFVALKGERFDAHDFLAQAKAAGASAALAERGLEEAGLPGLQVSDTLQALQAWAAAWRAQHRLPVIGVTGSNGKTTVTQMLASILRAAEGDAALATAGNLNNHIGVPMTVLRLREPHRLAVIELGMNHPGEIAELVRIAQPNVGLINNAQREHQEFMHTVEAVARENAGVITGLPADGVAVFPADDAYAALWTQLAEGRSMIRFASTESGVPAEVTGHATWNLDHWALQMQTPLGKAQLALRIAGQHNVKNALAATAAAIAAGVTLSDVVAGLQDFAPVNGRSQIKALGRSTQALTLVDDTYNANPDSVKAAIEVLAALPGPRWLVMGDMGEVGDQGPAFHAEVGAQAAAAGIEHVWCVGELMAHAAQACSGARHFADTAAAVHAVSMTPSFKSVLVKGSRFMKMEQVVTAIQNAQPTSDSSQEATTVGTQGGSHAA